MSLRTRLLVGLTVLVLVAVTSAGWLMLLYGERGLLAAQHDAKDALGRQIIAVLQSSINPHQPLDSSANVERIETTSRALNGPTSIALTVVDRAGATIYGAPVDDSALADARAGATSSLVRGTSVQLYAPLRADDQIVGAVRLALDDGTPLNDALTAARRLLWGIALVDGGLVLLFGALFIRRVVGPLEQLAQAARQVAAGDLEVPPIPRTTDGDEVARLTDAFNRMTGSLRTQRDQIVAQEKLASVGRLAAGVAHEVGNPLAAVLGYVDLLADDEDPVRRDFLERIRKETQRISRIVSDLLDYARPASGATTAVSLSAAVDAALSLLSPQPRFRDVTVERTLPAELPAATADEHRLVQVLVNLLLNAADATSGHGTITINAATQQNAIELTIRDDGPGVPADLRTRIFDPFFTTKEPGAGTGLGLALSRASIEACGGSLTLLPSEKGAAFALRLPLWHG